MEPPISLLAFQEAFSTEEKCYRYLAQIRWPCGFECPICRERCHSFLAQRMLFKCANAHHVSLTSQTVMHRSKQPLMLWFYASWLVTTMTQGVSALQLQRQLGIKRYETAWSMLHELRSCMIAPQRGALRGSVQVDETFVGGKEAGQETRGRGAKTKTLVAVATEVIPWTNSKGDTLQAAGRIRLQIIADEKADNLMPFICNNIRPESAVYTDGNQSYSGLGKFGYRHYREVGSKLETLNRVVKNLKSWLEGTHKGAPRRKHLQGYLNEYTFRFNRRKNPFLTFNRLLSLACHAKDWPTYEGLYHAGSTSGWQHPDYADDESGKILTLDEIHLTEKWLEYFAVSHGEATG